MSSQKFIDVYDNHLSDKQKNAMQDLWMKGVNHDGHVWVTYGDVEDAVAEIVLSMKEP